MAQGKQGIWMLTFPDRKTQNLVNLIFTQGKLWQHRKFRIFCVNFAIMLATK